MIMKKVNLNMSIMEQIDSEEEEIIYEIPKKKVK